MSHTCIGTCTSGYTPVHINNYKNVNVNTFIHINKNKEKVYNYT